MNYDEALLRMSVAIDNGAITFWDAATSLAILFDKSRARAADDIVAMRSKPGVMAIPKITEEELLNLEDTSGESNT